MQRDDYIDFLRAIGILCIILAHVYAPTTISNIRCFDVPLMLFVSGLSFSGKEINASWKCFFHPRILRLLVPTYLFLLLFFWGFYVIGHPWSSSYIINSFLLFYKGSIGYVWIINVFLMIMLITPSLVRLNNTKPPIVFYLVMFFALIAEEVVAILMNTSSDMKNNIVLSEYVTNILGYSIPFMLGLKIKTLNKKQLRTVVISIVTATVVFLAVYRLIEGPSFVLSPAHKYPPEFIFICYGCCISCLLWSLKDILRPIANNKFFSFMGQNTMWIYLWHIVYVIIFNMLPLLWWEKYFLVLLASLLTYYVQFIIARNLMRKSSIFKFLIG